MPEAAPQARERKPGRNSLACLAALLGVLLAGCAPPLALTTLDATDAYQRLNRSALGEDRLSETTLTTLRRHDLADSYGPYPTQTIAALHSQVVARPELWSELFALAELSYLTARKERSAPRYLAAAIYAYAFLFPDGTADRPSPYDPRFRWACDLYNLALSAAVTPPPGGEVVLRSDHFAVPFGTLDVALDQGSMSWGGRELVALVPTGRLQVEGLNNQYRDPGIGAPMAARIALPASPPRGFQVAPRLRVPTTLLLSIPSPRRQLASGAVHAKLSVYNIFDSGTVALGDRRVPLEYDQTAARAVSLAETAVWNTELTGFLQGTLMDRSSTRLVATEPHRQGRMPVVLIHGTASSPFRWADMVNDLLEDPAIRERFEFWVFSYATGNPIPYSAHLLRESLRQAIASLGGTAADPALGHMVLIGHSQGGLLAKMLVIDPGDGLWTKLSRRPLDQLRLSAASRDTIREMMFPAPVREVDRVVFIATPHRGSYLASFSVSRLVGRLVTLPLSITKAGAEVVTGNKDALTFDPGSAGVGSVYGMTPGNPFVQALSSTPVAPGIHVHSIIPVEGDGPLPTLDDGVVRYESAHIEPVESEKIVRSGHSTQANPVTIEEVRRILALQLARACPGGTCARQVTGAR